MKIKRGLNAGVDTDSARTRIRQSKMLDKNLEILIYHIELCRYQSADSKLFTSVTN